MNKKKVILLLFLVLIIVTGFELYNLEAMALWHDEAFSALLIKYDFREMMYRIGLDVHPPLYYIVLRGWGFLFGDSLFSLRSFSVFFSILTVLGVYLFIKEALRGRKLAIFCSILIALNSFQIQFAMEARMFTLGSFLIVISSYFLLKAIKPPHQNFGSGGKSQNWFWWLSYALAASCGIYTHYYVFFSVLAQWLFLVYWLFKESGFNFLTWLKNKNFQWGLGAYLLIVLSYFPWLKIFLSQVSQVQESYWIPPIDILSIPATFLKMTTGGGIDAFRFWYILVVLMIVIIAATIYALKKFEIPTKWLVFLLLVIPFLGASILSFKTSIYLDRYFIFTLPFYLTLMAGAILGIQNKKLRNILILIAIFGSLISFPIRWLNLKVDKNPGMAGAANYLNQIARTGEKIYVGSSFVYFTFKYYNQTGIQPKLYVPGNLPHFSGTALLSPEDLIKDFNQEVKRGETAWLINTTGFGNYQPTVPGNWLKLKEKGFQDVYDYRGWIIVTKYQVN